MIAGRSIRNRITRYRKTMDEKERYSFPKTEDIQNLSKLKAQENIDYLIEQLSEEMKSF